MTAVARANTPSSPPSPERVHAPPRQASPAHRFGDLLEASETEKQTCVWSFSDVGVLGLQRQASGDQDAGHTSSNDLPEAGTISRPALEVLSPALDAAADARLPRLHRIQDVLGEPPRPANPHKASRQPATVDADKPAPAVGPTATSNTPASDPDVSSLRGHRSLAEKGLPLLADRSRASAVFVALHEVDRSMRVVARLEAIGQFEREQLKDDIRRLLAAHGVTNADIVMQEQTGAAQPLTSKR